jgi:hypothetical protein
LYETPRQAESEEIQYKDLDKVAVRICNTPQNTGKTKSFPQSRKMISPCIDAFVDSDIMPASRHKTLARKRKNENHNHR